MKKLFKRILIFAGILGVIYLGYLFLLKPNGYANQEDLVISFIDNLDEKGCEEHFNPETNSICEVFIGTLAESDSVTFKEGTKTVDGMDITLTIIDDLGDEVDVDFEVTFISYAPTGLRSYLSDDYYLIDTIH